MLLLPRSMPETFQAAWDEIERGVFGEVDQEAGTGIRVALVEQALFGEGWGLLFYSSLK